MTCYTKEFKKISQKYWVGKKVFGFFHNTLQKNSNKLLIQPSSTIQVNLILDTENKSYTLYNDTPMSRGQRSLAGYNP